MSNELIGVIIAGYPVCLLLGWWVGRAAGHAYAIDRGRKSHWSDAPTGIIFLFGGLATLMLIANLIAGFIKGVQS